MYLLYSALLVAWGIFLIPIFLYRAWRHNKYLPGLSQRLGRLPLSLRFDGRPAIWFHSCSVGETLSLEPLVRRLHRRFPEARLVFSTITETGRSVASRRFAVYGEGNVFYFPVDLAGIAGRVLDWIRPSLIVIIDTEIWPNTLRQACRRGIPVVLANGRISAGSFRYYRWARPFLSRVFRNYALIMMQSDEDALRIKKMGAPGEKVLVAGNIKFDREPAGKDGGSSPHGDLAESLGLGDESAPLIIAGSTHPGEEQVLLEVLQHIRAQPGTEKTRLLLAPRHPERFDAVAQLVEQRGFRVRRRSGRSAATQEAEVLLLDTVGELSAAYQFAAVVFVGGSLIPHGGHSIMEPALCSKPIVVGPYLENFRHILSDFLLNGALLQISAPERDKNLQVEQLAAIFLRLLSDAAEREALGMAAFSILAKNRGAAGRTSERIEAIFARALMRAPGGAGVP